MLRKSHDARQHRHCTGDTVGGHSLPQRALSDLLHHHATPRLWRKRRVGWEVEGAIGVLYWLDHGMTTRPVNKCHSRKRPACPRRELNPGQPALTALVTPPGLPEGGNKLRI